LFDKKNFTGGLVLMDGTVVHYICRRQATMAENSTISEIFAVFEVGKDIQWIRLIMMDLGIPYTGPITIGEDNSATRMIAHGGKMSRNVRHVAVKLSPFNAWSTLVLPLFVRSARLKIRRITLPRFCLVLHCTSTVER
jgi:hypothetical protein